MEHITVGDIVAMGVTRGMSAAVKAAYEAPFPDETYKAGARRFPALVPVTPQHAAVAENEAAWRVLSGFTKPFLTAFSDADPVTKGAERPFQEQIPGARGQRHVTIQNAGHFVQEDAPGELVELLHAFVGTAG